ncbi:MAG: type II toxin-antitoxin system VapB family antitoxin [Deltaproteobacteria bacterium]|nr:type II toxin-antitoxin system VapB family antitoxin [Deltaproteobacteria bacterium]
MRTNIVLDDDLVEQGLALTNLKTKRDLVNLALRELVHSKRRKSLLALEGKLHWEGNLDEMRKTRFEDTG